MNQKQRHLFISKISIFGAILRFLLFPGKTSFVSILFPVSFPFISSFPSIRHSFGNETKGSLGEQASRKGQNMKKPPQISIPKIKVSYRKVSQSEVFLNLVNNGLRRYDEIADEMRISHSSALKIASELVKLGKLRKTRGGTTYACLPS
jgi:hypothetical protein